MSEPMRAQLEAYLDGELHDKPLQAMQAHLETCVSCREELAALRQLSETLRLAPLPASLPPAIDFSDQLMQRLPPRPAHPEPGAMMRAAWWLPVGMLTALVFAQASSVLNGLAGLAGSTGLLGETGAWFAEGSRQTLWFGVVQQILQNMLNLKSLFGLQVANDVAVGLQQWFINPLLWQVALALAYLACLAVWWSGSQASQADQPILE